MCPFEWIHLFSSGFLFFRTFNPISVPITSLFFYICLGFPLIFILPIFQYPFPTRISWEWYPFHNFPLKSPADLNVTIIKTKLSVSMFPPHWHHRVIFSLKVLTSWVSVGMKTFCKRGNVLSYSFRQKLLSVPKCPSSYSSFLDSQYSAYTKNTKKRKSSFLKVPEKVSLFPCQLTNWKELIESLKWFSKCSRFGPSVPIHFCRISDFSIVYWLPRKITNSDKRSPTYLLSFMT